MANVRIVMVCDITKLIPRRQVLMPVAPAPRALEVSAAGNIEHTRRGIRQVRWRTRDVKADQVFHRVMDFDLVCNIGLAHVVARPHADIEQTVRVVRMRHGLVTWRHDGPVAKIHRELRVGSELDAGGHLHCDRLIHLDVSRTVHNSEVKTVYGQFHDRHALDGRIRNVVGYVDHDDVLSDVGVNVRIRRHKDVRHVERRVVERRSVAEVNGDVHGASLANQPVDDRDVVQWHGLYRGVEGQLLDDVFYEDRARFVRISERVAGHEVHTVLASLPVRVRKRQVRRRSRLELRQVVLAIGHEVGYVVARMWINDDVEGGVCSHVLRIRPVQVPDALTRDDVNRARQDVIAASYADLLRVHAYRIVVAEQELRRYLVERDYGTLSVQLPGRRRRGGQNVADAERAVVDQLFHIEVVAGTGVSGDEFREAAGG